MKIEDNHERENGGADEAGDGRPRMTGNRVDNHGSGKIPGWKGIGKRREKDKLLPTSLNLRSLKCLLRIIDPTLYQELFYFHFFQI